MSSPSHSHAPAAHGDAAHSGEPPHGHPLVGHLVPISTLVGTGLALLVMTIITVAVRWIDLGEANIIVALGIAFIKATLVALFFMHLRWDRPFNAFAFVGSIAFVALFMGFALIDTHAYRHDRFRGNAAAAQTELNAKAPNAPITTSAPAEPQQ